MFRYVTEVLDLSEAEAYLRIEVARASRKHPMLLDRLSDGSLHLSGIATLAPILTESNRETVLARAAFKTKQEIKELVAELSPQPDVPDTIRKLPERREKTKPTTVAELRLDRVDSDIATPPASAPSKPVVVDPIAPARYSISFTASAELHDKLERLQSLLRSSGDAGDLASVIEAEVVGRYRDSGNRVSELAAVYVFSSRAASVRGVVPVLPRAAQISGIYRTLLRRRLRPRNA